MATVGKFEIQDHDELPKYSICQDAVVDEETGSISVGDVARPSRGRKRKEMCSSEAESEERRVTANYQERQRMMKLNTALDRLRQCLPEQFKLGNRRISKIRTLRLAASYIKSLGDILKQDAIIRESLPPQPGFEPRLPSLTDVNRQGDGGEMYTPEKDMCMTPSPESMHYLSHDYKYQGYAHSSNGSSPPFPYISTSGTLPHLPPFTQVPGYPMYPPHLYPPGLHPMYHAPMMGTVQEHL